MRGRCVRECDRIERLYICYTRCVEHNFEVSSHEEQPLRAHNQQVVAEVSELNTVYLALKDQLAVLHAEVRKEPRNEQ